MGERLLRYQHLLLDTPSTAFRVCWVLNPATLLPDENDKGTCNSLLCEDYRTSVFKQAQFKGCISAESKGRMVTDRSSFMHKGIRKAEYAVLSLQDVTEGKALPPHTLAQKAKLISLIWALQLGKNLRLNIYTDSKYGFLILHAHAVI